MIREAYAGRVTIRAGAPLLAALCLLGPMLPEAGAQNAGGGTRAKAEPKSGPGDRGAPAKPTPGKSGETAGDAAKSDAGPAAGKGTTVKGTTVKGTTIKEGSVVNRPTWTFRSADVTVTVTQLDTYMPGWRRFRVKAQLNVKGKERCTVTGRLTLLPDDKARPDREGASRGRGTVYVKVPAGGVGTMTLTVKESGDWAALKVDSIKLFEFWLD